MRKNLMIFAAFVLGLILAELPGDIAPGGEHSVANGSRAISPVAIATVQPSQSKW